MAGWLALALLSISCVQAPPKHPDAGLTQAVTSIAHDVGSQLGLARGARAMTIDPLIDARTSQQTGASHQVERELGQALVTRIEGLTIYGFDAAGAEAAQLLVTGTVTKLPEPDRYRISVALTDRASGIVVAQSVAPFRQAGLSSAPTRFYADSPSLTRDRSVEGLLRTSETPVGQPADPLYVEQVPTSALLADALDAYNAQKWEEALTLYTNAAARRDGQQLRTFNGIYLTNMQLGRTQEAEQAFAKIAALGLATNNLAIKLLFRPNSTQFWPDSKVSGMYPMWLKHVATAVRAAESCLVIVGHTSRSGTAAVNEKLSKARADVIRDWLEREAPGIAAKARTDGVGARENLVGSGTDDAADALDRRVEFRVASCR